MRDIKKLLLLFIVSVIFVVGSLNVAHAFTSGPLWLGTKSLPAKFLIEVAKGHVPGHSIVHKFGKATVGTTLVPITNSLEYRTPTTATALEFVSNDVNDTAAGSGAREITIQGLDTNWQIVTQVIATNGTTAVAIPTNLTRLFRWFVSSCGTYATATAESHTGTLTIRVASAGATWSTIGIAPRSIGQSQIACYTIPVGFRAFVYTHEIRVDSTKSADILMFVRNSADTIAAPFPALRLAANFIGVSGIAQSDTNAPRDGFTAPADIIFMGKIASGTAEVVIDFEILLIEDGY